MIPRRLIPLVLALGAVRAEAQEAEASFDALLLRPDLWTLSQDAFPQAARGLPFRWTSEAKDSARAAGRQRMDLFGRPIVEFIARFQNSKLSEITAGFYSRGDAGELTEEQFRTVLVGAVEAITRVTRVKHTVRGSVATNAVGAEGLVWQTPQTQYVLEYSFTRAVKSRRIPFRAEFIRLEARPIGRRTSLLTTGSLVRPRFNAAAHVRRNPIGDVWLYDVPMVDQGQKGYCVVASAERVLRYYGDSVDANELAQIANSDAQAGTDIAAMTDSLKKLASRLKLRVREHEKLDVRSVLDLMKDYNRAAKRAKESEIFVPGGVIDLVSLYATMKPPVLKEARTGNRSGLARFLKTVQSSINDGIPLLWSVQLGVIPEPDLPQAAGGHMRLIIGYNAKTQELIYSDSWGAGHERKRMKLDDAWTITTALMTIEPTT